MRHLARRAGVHHDPGGVTPFRAARACNLHKRTFSCSSGAFGAPQRWYAARRMATLGRSGSGGLPRLRRRSITAAGRGPGSLISNVSHRGCAMQAWSASEQYGRAHVSCLRLAPAAAPTAPTRVMLCRAAVWINLSGNLGAPDGRSARAPRGMRPVASRVARRSARGSKARDTSRF